jgi:zinc protease
VTDLDLALIPPLGEARAHPVPAAHETTLPNGLHVVVVPRPGVPLVELRLRVPFAAPNAHLAAVHTARAGVLSGAVLLGTERHDQTGIAEALQSHGAELSVTTDPDRLLFGTTLLADGLGPVLDLLAELLTSATYPAERVEGERNRVAERIGIARAQPGVIARTALAARRYGSHPYAVQLPDPELVLDVRAPALRRMHREHVLPAGSSLVLVGDLDPGRATDAVAGALSGWVGVGTAH